MNLIVLGPPGSGKGTQAKLIADKYGLAHISSGSLLREFATGDTPKAKVIRDLLRTGELLPFETVLEVVGARILEAKQGFVLDGIPRNKAQAEYMDTYFRENKIEVDLVIYLTLSDQEATTRLTKRAAVEGRSDDSEGVVKERLSVYHSQTQPVIEHYKTAGKLLEIDGAPPIEVIFQDIIGRLADKFPQQ